MTAPEAEALLLRCGYRLIRSRGAHRIYHRDSSRIVLPYHPGKILHPKIVKAVLRCTEETT